MMGDHNPAVLPASEMERTEPLAASESPITVVPVIISNLEQDGTASDASPEESLEDSDGEVEGKEEIEKEEEEEEKQRGLLMASAGWLYDTGHTPVEVAGHHGEVAEGEVVIDLEEEQEKKKKERKKRKNKTEEKSGEGKEKESANTKSWKQNLKAWWKDSFMYLYLASLLPPQGKDMDYRWELFSVRAWLKKLWGPETGKNRSKHRQNYPYPLIVCFYSWLGAFVGISLVAIITQYAFDPIDYPLLIGSYGATAVLLYAAPLSPLAQPKNVFLGHSIAAFIGVSCWKLMADEWYSRLLHPCSCWISLLSLLSPLESTVRPGAHTSTHPTKHMDDV